MTTAKLNRLTGAFSTATWHVYFGRFASNGALGIRTFVRLAIKYKSES